MRQKKSEPSTRQSGTARSHFHGSRTEGGATGYAITWKKGQTWKGHKVHMEWEQEAYDAECAAIARALETAAGRRNKLGNLSIFTDAQAAIWRMASHDPGPGQKYAIAVRRHIAELRRTEPDIKPEIRRRPTTAISKGTKKPTSAPSWPPTGQTHGGSGSATQTATDADAAPNP